MDFCKRSSGIFALIACVALVGSVAYAAQLRTINLPMGAHVQVQAVLTPGVGGAQFSDRLGWVDEEELRIVDFTGGFCSIVGGPAMACNSSHQHSISLDIVQTQTGFEGLVVVHDDVDNVTVGSQTVDLGPNAPVSATAAGESVLSLTAQ